MNVVGSVIGTGVVWLLTRLAAAAVPALQSLWNPVASLPLWISFPSAFFTILGIVSLAQSVGAALRRPSRVSTKSYTAASVPDPQSIDVDLRSINPLTLTCSAMTPQLWVYLRLTNLGALPLRATHITIRLSFGQILQRLSLDQPFDLHPYSVNREVGLYTEPENDKVAQIKEYVTSIEPFNVIYIDVTMTCESSAGPVQVSQHFERRPADLPQIIR